MTRNANANEIAKYQQRWLEFKERLEQSFEQQRIIWKQKQDENLARRQWENQKLLEIKQKIIEMEGKGATISSILKSAFKIAVVTSTTAGGALLGSVVGVYCGPGAPACIAVGGAIGAALGTVVGSTLSEIIDRNL